MQRLGRLFHRPLLRRLSSGPPSVNELYEGLLAKNRMSLAKSITLGGGSLYGCKDECVDLLTVESSRDDHKAMSQSLLRKILHSTSTSIPPKSFRIGLSGAPGVGKSSFIETFGMFLIGRGHRVAVLAVDPSSSRTGGSILGVLSAIQVGENCFKQLELTKRAPISLTRRQDANDSLVKAR